MFYMNLSTGVLRSNNGDLLQRKQIVSAWCGLIRERHKKKLVMEFKEIMIMIYVFYIHTTILYY